MIACLTALAKSANLFVPLYEQDLLLRLWLPLFLLNLLLSFPFLSFLLSPLIPLSTTVLGHKLPPDWYSNANAKRIDFAASLSPFVSWWCCGFPTAPLKFTASQAKNNNKQEILIFPVNIWVGLGVHFYSPHPKAARSVCLWPEWTGPGFSFSFSNF